MNVHELQIALTQVKTRHAQVTIEGGKLLIGGKELAVGKAAEKERRETAEAAQDKAAGKTADAAAATDETQAVRG